jgi:dihydrofolate synthase / folylpolyglutamate synthase
MSYHDTIAYLDSFINYEKKTRYPYKESFKLERIREFLGRIGNPHEGLRYIHVAGTKGKGSVCALTAYMLRQLGYRVGLYTSPHLSDVRERIRVLRPSGNATEGAGGAARGDDFEGMIPEEDLTRLTDRLRPEIAAYGGESPYGQLSFFEVYTALAFLYFKEQAVDYAVLETGLGGRLDATNVVQPVIVGITSISYDHMNKLGNTLARIAAEKAGIVKLGTLSRAVVSAPQNAAARSVIRARCIQRGVRLYEVGTDITYKTVSSSLFDQEFSVNGAFGLFDHMRINLLGGHQVVNAAVAIGLIAGLLKQAGKPVPMDALRAGLRDTRWPGRCEIVGEHPCIILDGAHNEASAAVLSQTISRFHPAGRVILVLGVSKDKDVAGIGKHLIPLAKQCVVTRADNPRALPPSDIVGRLKEYGAPDLFVETQCVSGALEAALRGAGKDDTIVVTGSLFIVGEARQLLARKAP